MLHEVNDRKEWNDLVLKNSPRSGGFLGSWEWGEFQERVGRLTRRLVFDDTTYAQVIEHRLPFGKWYWYVPRGGSVEALVENARKQGALFVRFEPQTRSIPSGAQKTVHVSPPTTLILDLTKSEDELLAAMHEKTRYNLRLAGRKGVRVARSRDFEMFWRLMQETAARDGFRTHPRSYYEAMLRIPWVELWVAEWDGKVLAAGLWGFFGDTATYLHGASSSEHRNIMAPYLLQWEVLRAAKFRGFKQYDFWGVQPSTTHYLLPTTYSWSGMTRFKTGFGGKVVEYPGTFDLPLSPVWYRIYKLIRTALRAGR